MHKSDMEWRKKKTYIQYIIIVAVAIFTFFIVLTYVNMMCFALEKNEIEETLAIFKPERIKGDSLEEIRNTNKLDEKKEIEGGIFRFDITEDGVVVVYGEYNQTLVIYNQNMTELHRLRVGGVNGVVILDSKILLFCSSNTCKVFDLEGKLISAYDLTNLEELDLSSEAYKTYKRICFANERKVASNKYYLANLKQKKYRQLDYHTEYELLVRENESGEKTVLLRRPKTWWSSISRIPAFVIIMIASLFLLNIKYRFFNKMCNMFQNTK